MNKLFFILVFVFSFNFCSAQVNTELVQKTLTTLQDKYDYNLNKINVYISKCYETINNSDMDYELKKIIRSSFDTNYVQPFRRKSYDLSKNSITNQIIEWMQTGFLEIIETEGKKYNSVKETSTTASLVGGYDVPIVIEETLINGKWETIKTERNNAYLFFDKEFLYFKRGDNRWITRKLSFKYYDDNLKSYIYDSEYGLTILEGKLDYILFYDIDFSNKRYFYYIGQKNLNIIPKN